jgi:hypothetical protein
MAGKKPSGRKRRTRQHVIADLGANYVERFALLCGFSVERRVHDYGIDLAMSTYGRGGEVENGLILVQVKSTDHLKIVDGGKAVAIRVSQAHFRNWLLEPLPVILILYDAPSNVAYWLYIQAYFEGHSEVDWDAAGTMITLHIPRTRTVDEAAMRSFAEYRDRILSQIRGVIRHD